MQDLSKQQHSDAINLWEFVQDTTKFQSNKGTLYDVHLRKYINTVASRRVHFKTNKRNDVILTAKFIANIEPSYLNSEGKYVQLSHLRAMPDLTEDDIELVCNKIEEVVKPFIVMSKETEIDSGKLRIKSSMSKKKLIHSAIRHLLLGSEVLDNPEMYNEVKVHSLLMNNVKVNYAYLVGLAISIDYSSVAEMMEDMCLKFVDQTENVLRDGKVVFYDGAIRAEKL